MQKIRFVASLFFIILLAGCGGSRGFLNKSSLTNINVTPRNLTLTLGQEQSYTAEGIMSDNTSEDISKEVTWAVSDTTVASFFKIGGKSTLLAIGAGTTTVTATLGATEGEGEAMLHVLASSLKSLQINPLNPVLEMGISQPLATMGKLSNGQTEDLTSGTVWSSSDPSIATIDASGVITALTSGVAVITATAGEMRSTSKLTVAIPTLKALKVTPSKNSIVAGRTQQFTAEGFFSNRTTQMLTANVTWNSSEPAVLSINASGLASAVAKGLKQPRIILITAMSGNINKSATLTITPPEMERIEVTPKDPVIQTGQTILLSAYGMLTDGTTIPLTSDISWRSSQPVHAAVSETGLVKVISVGTAIITASSKDHTGTVYLTATPPDLIEIRVSPAIPFIASGRTQQFFVEGSYSDGSVKAVQEGLAWSSANSTLVAVDQNGLATPVAKGITTPLPVRITAARGKVSGTAKLTVTPAELSEVHVIPVIPFVAAGKTQQFAAMGTFTDGTDQVLTGVKWSASDPTAVFIDNQTGLATTKVAKNVTVTASLDGIIGAAKLTITPPEILAIRISPDRDVPLGRTVPFTAEATFTDGVLSSITSAVKWSSSDPAMLLFKNNSNMATALSEGKVILTAAYTTVSGPITGTLPITVTPAVITKIDISPVVPIVAGQTVSFLANGTFTDNTVSQLTGDVKWHSSDLAILKIKENSSTATALAKGNVTLTATAGTVSQSVKLTVLDPVLTAIRIVPSESILSAGQTQVFTAEGSFTNGTTELLTSSGRTNTISFSSSNPSVVQIEKNSGQATTFVAGSATITAVSGKISNVANIIVNPPALSEIRVTPDKKTITAGETQQFFVEGVYTDKTSRPLKDDIIWSASDPSVITMNQEGIAKAATKGVETAQTVKVIATRGKVSGMTKLTVVPPELVSIVVTPMTASIVAGRTEGFTAAGTFTDGTTQVLTSSVKWGSSEPSMVTVSQEGLAATIIKGLGLSKPVNVTATLGKVQGVSKLIVTPAELTGIRLLVNETAVAAGRKSLFSAEGSFTDGTTRKMTTEITVSSSDPNVAIIDMGQGLVKTLRQGTVTLTAMAGKIINSTKLTVTAEELTELRVRTSSSSIAMGRTVAVTAEGLFTNGKTQLLDNALTWTSSHPDLLSINNDGSGKALGIGNITVTASFGNVSGTAKLTVTPAELTSLKMTPDASSVVAGRSQQFSLYGLFSDGQTLPVTSDVRWSSSVPSVATIETSSGLANALTQGAITITAISGNVKAIAYLTVLPPELTGVRITPKNLSLVSGKTQQFVIVGSFTDKTDRPLTSDITWKSSDTSVATINQDGLATSASRGVDIPLTVRISSVYGKWTDTTNLTIIPTQTP
jgi:uncharacterized protein YjdB